MDPDSPKDRSRFADAMKRFYEERGQHDFPWRREEASPYEVLLAVVFLQRTRREQAADVFGDFVSRFPDVQSLAGTDPEEIRSVMEPLGLHWRAENVHKMGKIVMKRFEGKIPGDKSLFELPGVGSYVGNMVLCLAFGRRTAPVDANVGRVLNRVFGLNREGITERFGRDQEILNLAEECLPEEGIREYNLGLLDFGNEVCRPRDPRCGTCPLTSECCDRKSLSKYSRNPSPSKDPPYESSEDKTRTSLGRQQV